MNKRRSLFWIVYMLFFLLTCRSSYADDAAVKNAVAASDTWLIFVDNGQYSKSWETAAEYFKIALGKEQWDQTLKAVRKPLGKVIKRQIKSKQYTTNLPGAPDGEYVVIQYETSFENKKSSIETVTPMLDNDGKWRVSGYYIK